jgi:hypothetical protein
MKRLDIARRMRHIRAHIKYINSFAEWQRPFIPSGFRNLNVWQGDLTRMKGEAKKTRKENLTFSI